MGYTLGKRAVDIVFSNFFLSYENHFGDMILSALHHRDFSGLEVLCKGNRGEMVAVVDRQTFDLVLRVRVLVAS